MQKGLRMFQVGITSTFVNKNTKENSTALTIYMTILLLMLLCVQNK